MPKYVRHVFVCGNERAPDHPRGSCARAGAGDVRDALKAAVKQHGLQKTVRVNQAGCLDQCEHGPTLVVYPEAVWYGYVTVDDVNAIVSEHLAGGAPVARLMLPDDCINNPNCPHRRPPPATT